MTPSPVIETKGLTKVLGGRAVVDGIDLTVRAGEVYGFLGPNGAGKTTTLRMLLGLLAQDSGTATVLGLDSRRQGPALRRSVGYVSQARTLYPDLTVEENLSFFGRMYGLRPAFLAERVGAGLERFQLSRDARRLLGAVPTGTQRRCSLAVALLHGPRLLILDEPTSGMDTTSRREFWAFLGGLVAAETTVILTTHHLEEVQVCDRLCLMLAGHLHYEGTPAGMAKVFPGHALLVSSDGIGRVHQILKKRFGASLLGSQVRIQRPAVEPEEVLRVLEGAGVHGAAVERVAPTLEDAFVRAALQYGSADEAGERIDPS